MVSQGSVSLHHQHIYFLFFFNSGHCNEYGVVSPCGFDLCALVISDVGIFSRVCQPFVHLL